MDGKTFWKARWDDIRPNLLWYGFFFVIGGGLFTAITAGIKILTDNPVTIMGAIGIFTVSLTAAVVGYVIYRARSNKLKGEEAAYGKAVTDKWIVVILSIAVISLIGWDLVLQQRIRHLEVKMIRYVLPRQLTQVQIEEFGKYLASNSQPHEVRIRYIMGDSEAQRYADDFASAFKAGKWLPNMMAVNPAAITCRVNPAGSTSPFACSSELQEVINSLEGINITQTGPNLPQPSTLEEKINRPKYAHQIVSEALNAAGIPGISSGYSSNNDPLNTITVFVGFRPRDKFGVLPQKRGPEYSFHDLSDDDF